MKRAFVMDSTLAISTEAAAQDGIEIVPLNLVVNNETFKDLLEIAPDTFYVQMAEGAETSTSQPSPAAFLETYEKFASEGAEEIFVFTLSSVLSGTYQSATMAAEMFEGTAAIHVIDTLSASAMLHVVIRNVMAMADASAEEILAYVDSALKRMEFNAYLGDFTYLKKGGRLSASQAMIGTLLKINLIFNLEGGGVNVFAKERKASNAIKRIMKEISEKKAAGKTLEKVVFLETNLQEFRKKLSDAFAENFPEDVATAETFILSPVLGSHTGPEAAAVVLLWNE